MGRAALGARVSRHRRVALLGLLRGTRRRRYDVAVCRDVLFFFASFAMLAVMFWPYMIPYSITVAGAAAPDASLSFLFYGAGIIMLPVIAAYTIRKYWIFRGKAVKLH